MGSKRSSHLGVSGLALVALLLVSGCARGSGDALSVDADGGGTTTAASTDRSSTSTSVAGGADGDTAQDADLTGLIAAAVRHRVMVDNSFGVPPDFDRLLLADEFDAATRDAIKEALAPMEVSFVPDDQVTEALDSMMEPGSTETIAAVSVSDPGIVGDSGRVYVGLDCGPICAISSELAFERDADGSWVFDQVIGPQIVS